MNPRERKRRRAENLRKPRTVMANAFFEALRKWATTTPMTKRQS